MKKGQKIGLTLLLTLSIFVGCFLRAEQVLMHKWESNEHVISKKTHLLELPEDSLDVLFLGASATYVGFHPARLYQETGIRSFNLGTSLQPPLAVYYNLLEAMEHHNLKVVVIDFSFLDRNADPLSDKQEPRYQRAYDSLVNPELKRAFLRDLHELNNDVDCFPYKSPFYRYHNRWKKIDEKDFIVDYDYQEMMLGGRQNFEYLGRDIPGHFAVNETDKALPYDDQSKKVYDRLIQTCQDNNITLVSILPRRNEATWSQHLLFQDYAEQNQMYFIDFNMPEVQEVVQLDYATEYYDGGHVNMLGARKMTDFIGNFLLEKNLITPESYPEADSLYANWAKEYAEIPVEMELVKK